MRYSEKKNQEVMDEVFKLVDVSIGDYLVEESAEKVERMPEVLPNRILICSLLRPLLLIILTLTVELSTTRYTLL